ncbi:LLM class flavin-dependent oxidoreductase [Lysinibacillus irui]|uniref:LLM class flavin-dependent oxidoreductase n=2 Tax=Lysinibacillus TaxID=400634 RepID=A0ABU5NFT8_9BACI|nr:MULTISPECIES: LLM class flavin-dependent oxidoreductase [Lysinibacillus]MCM0626692.1 LLM class flavin-dependent oxidoreductase [Lysinibacillus sp. OL1_EC]MEA0554188.1 LLM class flavin-dependent oxidoreductase [Lysinibacillus irui]MEA0974870.1 LLM class flavin-dependent oxidoreductase [Lysinibacillus irui]MEA1041024.1 LLM class flavin-dependent oxidoreductase [Lysinibacillus irui]TBV89142.1 LLM class flavin-dependent oxidoreductase [Lysinibacillus sp. OL1]
MSNIIKNEIKGYISSSGWTLTEIVNKMNENLPDDKKTTVQNISNKLTRGTIKYSEVKEIADIIGMNIEWNKKEEIQ